MSALTIYVSCDNCAGRAREPRLGRQRQCVPGGC
jgi:hypothetical protein